VNKWATYLPIVQAIMNNAPNTTTGLRPVDDLLGPCNHTFYPIIEVNEDEDENAFSSNINSTRKEVVDLANYITEFRANQKAILKRSDEYYEKFYKKYDKQQTSDTTYYL
jgi:hypothetical protein